jgi:hypothetical protein
VAFVFGQAGAAVVVGDGRAMDLYELESLDLECVCLGEGVDQVATDAARLATDAAVATRKGLGSVALTAKADLPTLTRSFDLHRKRIRPPVGAL